MKRNNYFQPNLQVGKQFIDPIEAIQSKKKKKINSDTSLSNNNAKTIIPLPLDNHNKENQITIKDIINDANSANENKKEIIKESKIFRFFSKEEEELLLQLKNTLQKGKEEEIYELHTKLMLDERKLTNEQILKGMKQFNYFKLNDLYEKCHFSEMNKFVNNLKDEKLKILEKKMKDNILNYNNNYNWCTIVTIMEELPIISHQNGISYKLYKLSENLDIVNCILFIPTISQNKLTNKDKNKLKEEEEENKLSIGDVFIICNPIILNINLMEMSSQNKCEKKSPFGLFVENKNSLFKIGKAKELGVCSYVPIFFNKYEGSNLKVLEQLRKKKEVSGSCSTSNGDNNNVKTVDEVQKGYSFCNCAINKTKRKYCDYHFQKRNEEIQESRVECNTSNIATMGSSNMYLRPTVYMIGKFNIYVDPEINIKKLKKNERKPQELNNKLIKPKKQITNNNQITLKMAKYLSNNERISNMFIEAQSSRLQNEMKIKNKKLTDEELKLIAKQATLLSLESAKKQKNKQQKRKVVELEISEDEEDSSSEE
ncbi:hypothetical protein ABK040_007046 [Willaertia magna]